ncbi:MAG: PspC domain-containing protein [Bacteroidota bacterium]
MNKTVNINLGGMFFHIDEDAYQKLTRYFDAIKRSLSNSNGQDEIIKDIEMRIGELVTEKHTSDKQVINLKEVDEIIAVMGQPEDYRIDTDGAEDSTNNYYAPKRNKKLYRDTEKGMIGGVATGLGHYFGVEAIWIKLAFILFVWAGGSGIIIYLILWAVTPEAVTTTEKLEMTGEPVTISNIEKKVREEFENVSERFKNANYDAMGNQVKTGAEKFASGVGNTFSKIFGAFAKVLGAIITVWSVVVLVSLLVALFTLGSTSIVDVPWQNYIDAVNYTDIPLWTIGLLFFFAVGIPFFFLLILGLKLLINNMKSIGSAAKYSLLALWLLCVVSLIVLGIKQATEIGFEGKVVEKVMIPVQQNDTLYVKFRFNDYYSKSIDDREDFLFTQDANNVEQIYSNDVQFHVLKTDEKVPYIQVEKIANGKSLIEAKKRAEKIKYAYKIEGNHLILDNYLLTEIANRYRSQEVHLFLYLPNGIYFKPDSSVEYYDRYSNSDSGLEFSSYTDVYKVVGSELKCLNCIEDNEGDENDEDAELINITGNENDTIKTVTVKVGGKEFIKTETTNKKGLKQSKDGIIIKNH